MNAARKLRTVRRLNRWANKSYKKAHLGTQFKCNPFGGSSHCKGIVLEKMCVLPPLPPSRRARRPAMAPKEREALSCSDAAAHWLHTAASSHVYMRGEMA